MRMGKYSYRIISRSIMAKGWSSLTRLEVEATDESGQTTLLPREVADHGDGATVLPVDWARGMVLLVRQWRAGVAFGGHEPFLLETCAGLLDADHPEECVRREALEELGTRVRNIRHIADCYTSPGALSERLSLFIADYEEQDRIHQGGGLAHEHEDIEVVELPLAEAYEAIARGGIRDAKTIILLQHAMMQLER
ncbi:MAG: NUDIX domain-containing protein [Alphaproteobacteria bacterium]|nr:NUDIX domain-containing protein [Alphaproteobacteria bacterium]